MELDVEQLQKDLQELQQKKEQAAERLRTLAPRGRGDRFGRGRGFGSANSAYSGRFGSGAGRGAIEPGSRGIGRRLGGDGYQNSYDEADWETGSRRGGSFAGRFVGRAPYSRGAPFGSQDTLERTPVAAPRKRTLSSAVVVDGEQRIPGRQAEAEEAPPSMKRPAPSELDENPAIRKRNRRMFGNLLGTLQRFKEEEKAFQQTPTGQKQAVALKRAEEKAAAEGLRLRQMERQKKVAERQAELDKIRQFNLQSDIKALEILYAKKILNRQRCLAYLFTKSSPALYWVPKKHTKLTSASLLKTQDEFEKWKAEQQKLLEEEKQKLREDAAARKAAALARANKIHEAGGLTGASGADDEAVAKEEAELEEQLQQGAEGAEGKGNGNGPVNEAAGDAAVQIDKAQGKEGPGDDGDNGAGEAKAAATQSGSGEPEEEDGELPDAAEDDDRFRNDDAETNGGDLLDKLEVEPGNPDAENIEDLLQ